MGLFRPTVAAAAMLLLVVPLPASGGDPAPAGETVTAPAAFDAAARAQVAALPRATTVNDRSGNKRFDDLDAAYAAAPAGARLPVIVSFTDGTSTDEGLERVREVVPDAAVRRSFTIIPAFAGDLTDAEALRVAALAVVRQVELDRDGTPELADARGPMGVDAVLDELGITGSLDGMPDLATTDDVGIAVLDTGIYDRHADLEGKVVGWKDFGTNRPAPYDPGGHGTHVASIAAGWGAANPDLRGVAPGASLIGIKIDGGGNTTSNAIAGYEWVVEQRDELGIRIATISFGFGTATDGTTALERAVDATWDAGIVTFKSNGNGGPAHGTMTVPAAARGILSIGSLLAPFGDGFQAVCTPAGCVGVGSAYPGDKHGFLLSEFSSRGPTSDGRVKPDLVAPGETIHAANNSGSGYISRSGTSMAAPFGAGAAALVIAADPTLEPDDVRDILFATAENRGADGPDNDFGYGRIQVWEAVAAAVEGTGEGVDAEDTTEAPDHDSFSGTATAGVFEADFTVTDTSFPVAAAVLSDQLVHAVDVVDGDGLTVAQHPVHLANNASRQHHLTFVPDEPGNYTLRAAVTPASEVVVDISHSLKAPD